MAVTNVRSTKVNSKHQSAAVLFLLSSLIGCSEQNYPDDERFKPWRIGAATSYNYPAGVNEAYGVNYEEDWTSIMLPYGGLGSPTRYDIKKYRKYTHPDYDGYALPVGVPVNFTPDQLGSGLRSLPDELYVYWGSHGYRYATVVEVTPQIKAAMVKPYPREPEKPKGVTCYQTDFIFGLLPDGRAKLWLKGCAYITYVGEYKPTKAVPVPPPKPEKKPRELTPDEIEERDKLYEKLGIAEVMVEKPIEKPLITYPRPSLDDPIPWEKVNKVWYNPNYMLQTLDEAVPPTSLNSQ
nr:DUF2931 family protein [Vibrio brasiliensis]